MKSYMDCLRQNSGQSTPCRALSKDYLNCRMEKYVDMLSLLFRN
jgi:cytochrome c oxidase assembly protein subunit 19